MLAFTVFWAYISFSQYFLIYSSNIPEETFWYYLREFTSADNYSPWWWLSMGLIFGQFVVPFLLLLWYPTKVIKKRLFLVACWMIFMHLVDMYWNILPGIVYDENHVATFRPIVGSLKDIVYDVAMVVGVGGIMVWSFLKDAGKNKAIPIRDPRILESIHANE